MTGKLVNWTGVVSVLLSASALGGITASSAQAMTLANPGFESGDFSGWSTIGPTSVRSSDFGVDPVEGNFQAVLSNEGRDITDAELEDFLGLTAGSLDSLGDARNGSAIKRIVTVASGDSLKFSWNFLTAERAGTTFNDFSFFSVVGTTQVLQKLADTNSPSTTAFDPFRTQTEYDLCSYTFNEAGTYTIGFGVVDVRDGRTDSALLVDDVSLTSTTPIPTPALLPGLVGMGVAALRKRRDEEVAE